MHRVLFALIITSLLITSNRADAAPRKLVLIGDSTVKNGQGRGDGGLWGWGQVLQPHFDVDCLVVENRALGGRSSRTYLTEGLWQRSLDSLRAGDYVLMQFGHNDGGQMFDGDRPRASIKGNGDESQDGVVEATGAEETVHSYGWYLRCYIADAKAKGAVPIVLSPAPRNIWRDGKVARASADYGKWAKEAAEQAGAPFIDLNEIVAKRYEEEGQQKVAGDFFTAADHTHTTRAGALVNAECVAKGIRGLEASDLSDCLLAELVKVSYSVDFGGPSGDAIRTPAVFDAGRGHGFEPGASVEFVNASAGHACVGDGAFAYSFVVPDGNWLVEATLGSPEAATKTRVEAELRRQMTDEVATEPGAFETRRFVVNTRTPAIEAGGSVRLKPRERGSEAAAWDRKLTLRFTGERPAVSRLSVTPAPDVPTIYLLGDSTVADQPEAPWASWGQKLPVHFRDDIAVANHSESGETVRGFWNARRFDKVLERMRPGDWLLIQFGHNDMKSTRPDALKEYRNGLKRAVEETRRRGATPVLVTSMERMAGVEKDTLGAYPQTVRDLAAEMDAPVIDLHAASKALYRDLGERLPEAFQDATHHTDFGAERLARSVANGIGRAVPDLASHLKATTVTSP
ncbi:Rhamnogalacturonan acetylesterase RhgT [Botrimarina colliarenosi]|uniref:Rhamnogalacturonan acetylesterase RhgT n=1 Tax=Botrimarina colliarenosi TaxID=2528001 RepID=A0A5C5ZYP6_9BACT|nr:rhamnogalacturonan acetylesterase [Botrimarina colliarenosi]TWT92306.1 Rhamnogalacturonan acetylesterase RhgT [Botrimarina colliarenosi]